MDNKRLKEFQQQMKKLQKELSAEEFFSTLNSKLLDFAAKNPGAPISEIEAAVREIFPPQVLQYKKEIFIKFEDTLKIVNDLYDDLGSGIDKDLLQLKRIEKVTSTYLGAYEKNESAKLVKAIREGLLDKLSRPELAKKIGAAGSRAASYADVIAQTEIKGYAREAKHQKAQLGEVFNYRYVGIIRGNSRLFCINEMEYAQNKSRHINEINALDNGPKQLKPVIVYCGGWGCYHDWEPDPF
jgi:hypothetical protein